MSSFNYEKALSIDWNGKMFVLTVRKETGMQADYLYSLDGKNWKTSHDLSNSTSLDHKNPYNVKWTGSQYVMVGDVTNSEGTTILKSKDGETFSRNLTNLNTPIYDLESNLEFQHTILFPKNITLALGGSPTNQTKIAYSLDEGITWTPSVNSASVFTETANAAHWNGKIWVAVGKGNNTIATSVDGIYWTGRGAYIFTEEGRSVFWSKEQSIWVAAGSGNNSIAYSYDGVYWMGSGNQVLTVVYDVKWNGHIWVAVGTPVSPNKSLAYSYDGQHWQVPSQNDLFDTRGIKLDWNGVFWTALGISATNNMATSHDGIHWKMQNNTFLTNFNTETTHIYSYLNNTFILHGQNAVSLTTNHNYYQLLTTPIQTVQSVRSVLYNGTYYLLGGDAIISSTDGINWSNSPVFVQDMSSIKQFAWNHPYLGTPQIKPLTVALGEGNNTMAYSEDGIFWKGLGNTLFSERGNKAIWNGTIWVAVGKGLFWVASSYDGIHWLGRDNTLMTESYDVAWNGTVFVAVGYGQHNMAVSSDGIHWYGIPNANSLFSLRASAILWTGKMWLAYGSGNNTTAYSLSMDGWIWNPTEKRNQVITNATSILNNTRNNVFSSSSQYSISHGPQNAFDHTMDNSGSTNWFSENNTYNIINGNYNGNTVTQYDGVFSISGEWIQIKTDTLCKIKYYHLSCYLDTSGSYYNIPKKWYVLGSKDETTWKKIDYFDYNTVSPPISNNFPFLVKLQNVYSNSDEFLYYRFVFPFIFPGGSNSFVRVSEIDLFYENENSCIINERIRPIMTKQHLLYQTNIVSFSNYTKTIYQLADLYGTPIDIMEKNQQYYTTNIVTESGEETTSFCFDGENLITTQRNGEMKHIKNEALNTVSYFDVSRISQNIMTNIYSSCYNGQRIIIGGNTLSYSSPFYKNPIFYGMVNTETMFTKVYGLASNPGYGFLNMPNRIYFSPGDKVSIIGPKAYNKNISNSNQIAISLYNNEIVQNITLPSSTIIFGLLGPTGPRGAGIMGPAGEPGLEGVQGPTGFYGGSPYGTTGLTGNKGPTGITGDIGPTGMTGEKGPQGEIGSTGCMGPTGFRGPGGPEGPMGPVGMALWKMDNQSNLNTESFIGFGKEASGDYVVDISGELYTNGEIHSKQMKIQSNIGIANYLSVGNRNENHTVDICGNVLTQSVFINRIPNNENNIQMDISGDVYIRQFTLNKMYKNSHIPAIDDATHIRMNAQLGDSFYLNIGNTISDNFVGIVENLPLTKLSEITFSISLIIDYKDAYLNERFYCQLLNINGQSYPVYFNNGTPNSSFLSTNNFFVQHFTILCLNSTILKVMCNVQNYYTVP